MIAEEEKIHSRVVVIGDSSVGKTSILNQLIDHNFNQYETSTIGANYQLFVTDVEDTKIEMQIWDTAGQEKFRSLGPIYFRNAVAAIAVFDCTNRSTFDHLEQWIREFTDVAGTNTVIGVAANKCDLESSRQISQEQASQWASQKGYVYHDTSAVSGVGIQDLFTDVALKIIHVSTSSSPKSPHEVANISQENKKPCC